MKYDELKKQVTDLGKNKKFQIVATTLIFLIILISSVHIRMSNLPVLVDKTTGLYTSNDLDSLYFYRIAETKIANGGVLPAVDVLRSPGYNVTWLNEILPDVMIGLYNVEKVFVPSMTFNYSATISGPIIFALLLIAFFALTYLLTKSKVGSLLASAFLAFAPAFLFRSIAGFYDHDHLGVFAVILFLIALYFSLKRLENNWKETIIWGIVLGFFTTLVLVSWGGAITFLFVLLPLAALIYYLLICKKTINFLVFYLLFLFSSIVFPLIFGFGLNSMVFRLLDSAGLPILFVFAFVLIDFLIMKFKKETNSIKNKKTKTYSLGITVIFGIIGLFAIGKNPLTLVKKAWSLLIFPFFAGFGSRLETTVAENAQPYLQDLIAQTGQILFALFIVGLIFIVFEFVKNLKNIKHKIYLAASMIFVLLAILYSRYSPNSSFNGENFISQALYLVGALTFFGVFVYVYSKDKIKVDVEHILLFALALTSIINARAAVRSFFLITPFICLIAALGIVKIFNYPKKTKDEIMKLIAWGVVALVIIFSVISLIGNPITKTAGTYQISSQQAERVGASTNSQWQEAMAWARNSTQPRDVFVHWWDYGYFIETLANRPTVTDGGHSAGGDADHYIGRYILTTSNPLTAYSYMKTWNVSYLLIDPTELGKYGAFSKIGSDDSWDRISAGVPSGVANSKDNKETSKGMTRLYNVQTCVDGDINYNGTFLPGMGVTKTQQVACKSYLGGIVIEQNVSENNIRFNQPRGIFLYNNQQYYVPIKNLYFNGQMVSFENGIDAVAYVIPNIVQTNGQYGLDTAGAVMYLSPRVMPTLIGQLYVLEDYNNQYSGLTVAHTAQDPTVSYFNQAFGTNIGEFVYFQGLRAPLKVWNVEYPEGTETHEEFVNREFTFGGMDKFF